MGNENNSSGARHQTRTGTVSSAGGDKTIRVVINYLVKHPVYGKYIRRRTKMAVHDVQNTAQVGDVVEIVPCRRISKTKSWRLIRVVRRSTAPVAAAGKEG